MKKIKQIINSLNLIYFDFDYKNGLFIKEVDYTNENVKKEFFKITYILAKNDIKFDVLEKNNQIIINKKLSIIEKIQKKIKNKLDNLMGLFSVGKIPTGSKDPFGLRRAAAGIVKIAMEHKIEVNLSNIIDNLLENYTGLDKSKLIEFFNERLFKIFEVNPSVIKAVLGSGEGDVYKISQKICALNPIVLSEDFKEASATFKRVANIIKDIDVNSSLNVNSSLFEQDEERDLFETYTQLTDKKYNDYEEELDALFSLKPKLDKFFDNVFVNHENETIKTNRKNLIGLVYQAFRNIADIKEITI